MELILLLFLLISIILFSILTYLWRNKKDKYGLKDCTIFSIIGLCAAIICLLFLLSCTWQIAYDTPYEYMSAKNTVDDTNALLMKYENVSNIGSGLEAQELKQTLSDKIEKENELEMKIHAYLDSPFALWKGVMQDRCRNLGIKV